MITINDSVSAYRGEEGADGEGGSTWLVCLGAVLGGRGATLNSPSILWSVRSWVHGAVDGRNTEKVNVMIKSPAV